MHGKAKSILWKEALHHIRLIAPVLFDVDVIVKATVDFWHKCGHSSADDAFGQALRSVQENQAFRPVVEQDQLGDYADPDEDEKFSNEILIFNHE